MTSEIPLNTETEQLERDFNPMYARVMDILEYQNEYPDKDWSDVPELVYMEVSSIDGPRTLSIRKFIVSNYDNHEEKSRSGLWIELYYIPSEIPLKRLRRIKPTHCKVHDFTIAECERTARVRELYGLISGTISESQIPTKEEIQKDLNRFHILLTPREKRKLFQKSI